MHGQRLAPWPVCGSALWPLAQLLELLFDRGQIAVQRFRQKARLHAIERFTTARKAHSLVARQLVAKLFDARAFEKQLALE